MLLLLRRLPRRLLDRRQCSCRIHFDCVSTQKRFASPAFLKPESFVCVDCCALPRFGNKKPRSFFTGASVDELAEVAAEAKEKALEKVRDAKQERHWVLLVSGPWIKDDVLVVLKKRDDELALKLHLAMNGSQRILRSGRSISSSLPVLTKRGRRRKLMGVAAVGQWRMIVAKAEQGSCSDKDNNTLTGWIKYQRGSKSKGVGSRERSSEKKEMLNGIGAGENSCELEKMSRCDPPDRYAKKYIKRKSDPERSVEWGNGCRHMSCPKASSFSDFHCQIFLGTNLD